MVNFKGFSSSKLLYVFWVLANHHRAEGKKWDLNAAVASVTIQTPLRAADYRESGCLEMHPARGLKVEQVMNQHSYSKFSTVPSWYIPMASKHFYYSWAEVLLGRPMLMKDADRICMKILMLAPKLKGGLYDVIVGGFGNSVVEKCRRLTKAASHECMAITTKASPATKPGLFRLADNVVDYEATIIGNGHNDYVVMGRCIRGRFKDWAVLAPDWRTVNDTVVKAIQDTVLDEYEFKASNIMRINYTSCSHKTYRVKTGKQHRRHWAEHGRALDTDLLAKTKT